MPAQKESSFRKGEDFENFVYQRIFPQDRYTVIHRTHNSEQNSERFIENTLKPDFLFRCIETGLEFYVEAKFRSVLYSSYGQLELVKPYQYQRFLKLEKEEKKPVYIIVGYEGVPTEPDYVSLLPLKEFSHSPNPSVVEAFRIEKTALDPKNLTSTPVPPKFNNAAKEAKPVTAPVQQEKPAPEFTFKSFRQPAIVFGIVLVALLSFLAWRQVATVTEQDLHERVTAYYQSFEAGDFNRLDEFINPRVDRWFTDFNVDRDQIKKGVVTYREKYPDAKAEIQWNTFKWKKDDQGNFRLEYELLYKLRKKGVKLFKVYHLKVFTVWDPDLMLSSMYEENLN